MDLITGGTGIAGVHLLYACAAAGEKVRALYRKDTDRSIVDRIFKFYGDNGGELVRRIEWVEGDLLDVRSLKDAMDGITRVHHAAAMVSFAPGDKRELFRVNVTGTANIVNAALTAGVKRICHVSSTAAIGKAAGHMERDESLPWMSDHTTSPYAASKYEAELEVYRGIAEGLEAVIVNPCVIIGPGIRGRSTMTLLEKLHKSTRFYPPGSNAIVDARDVALCMRGVMDNGPVGERYLLVGENISYKELFSQAADIFGNKAPSYALSPWMLNMGWRVERVRGMLFGGTPIVTRSTAHSAMIRRAYSNSKVRELLGIEFRTAREALSNVKFYMNNSPE